MQLRDYQIRTLNQIWDALQCKLNVLLTAPCSAGKTILFSKIIQRLLAENSSFRTLTLVDREILVSQSREKLAMVAPELSNNIGVVCASVSDVKRVDAPVTIASRQSLINQLDQFPPVQLIIIDEVHLVGLPHQDNLIPDQWGQIIAKLQEYNPNVRILGCTASPYRLGSKGGYIYGNRNRADAVPYFEKVDAKITTRELLDGEYITPLVGMSRISSSYNADIVNVKMIAGEFNLGMISDMMCKPVHVQSCIDAWEEYAEGRKKTLVFCTSIEHAEKVAEAFRNTGVSSCAIHSKLSRLEVAARMEALVQGTKSVFTSVAKLTTGMDVSDIDCIIMARPTKSAALYKQCLGRGQRLAKGKTDCLVIDLTGCTTEFGTDMDNLNVAVPRGVGGEAPQKICPGNKKDGSVCGAAVHASLKYCPTCGFEFPSTVSIHAAMGVLKPVVFNKEPEKETYTVTYVDYQPHVSARSGKELIKVTYECGFASQYYDWVCLPDFYSGYAVEKAVLWWEQRSIEPFPETIEEFMFLTDEIEEPSEIIVVKKGKFGEIVDYVFDSNRHESEESEQGYQDMENEHTPDAQDVPF